MQHERRLCKSFLGAFAKLRKANISFVMSVGLSVRPSLPPSITPPFVCPYEQLGSHWTFFHEIWYLRIFFSKNRRENSSFIKI
jgi:hypothetical protein